MAIISTNSQTKAELAVIPSCSGVNLKKEKKKTKKKKTNKNKTGVIIMCSLELFDTLFKCHAVGLNFTDYKIIYIEMGRKLKYLGIFINISSLLRGNQQPASYVNLTELC